SLFATAYSPPKRGRRSAERRTIGSVSRLRGATGALRSAPSPFGATPVAIFGSRVLRFRLRHYPPERVERSFSRPGRSARRADPRASRGRGYEPPPQDATSRSAFKLVSRRRPR